MSDEIHIYSDLKQQIHKDLRTQHPEWIQPDGKCPECDEHEARLTQSLEALPRSELKAESGQRASVEDETIRSSP